MAKQKRKSPQRMTQKQIEKQIESIAKKAILFTNFDTDDVVSKEFIKRFSKHVFKPDGIAVMFVSEKNRPAFGGIVALACVGVPGAERLGTAIYGGDVDRKKVESLLRSFKAEILDMNLNEIMKGDDQ